MYIRGTTRRVGYFPYGGLRAVQFATAQCQRLPARKDNWIASIAEIGMAFNRRWRDHVNWCSQRYRRGDAGAHEEVLSKCRNAWLAYYRDVRRPEEELMAERHQERMADLEAGWKSRPEPDLPPHPRDRCPCPTI